MQRDAVYLADILSAAADLREFAHAASLEEFRSNKTLRYAMLHALTVIGEASSKLSAELKERHGEVPWLRVSALPGSICTRPASSLDRAAGVCERQCASARSTEPWARSWSKRRPNTPCKGLSRGAAPQVR